MGQLNANMPYIECMIRPEMTGLDGLIDCYIFGVKSMLNRPMHFHSQASNGAVFWNMPVSAFVHKKDYEVMSKDENERLALLESWDCQSNVVNAQTSSDCLTGVQVVWITFRRN